MMNLLLPQRETPLKILCLGAHSDDIEIGCGGTILALTDGDRKLDICWVVFSAKGERRREAESSACALLSVVHNRTIVIKDFRDGFFPYFGKDIKDDFEELKKAFDPDLIFSHHRSDLHQDHRLISELTWNTFRDHLIWEYEIPKYDGDLGSPNVFVPLDENLCINKFRHITSHFATQLSNQWFSRETFAAVMRLRGIESNSPSGYAEAFYARKLIVA